MIIYKITNNVSGDIYVGKTTQKLNRRISRHFYNASKGSDTYLYRAMRKYGKDNFTCDIIETVSEDINRRERYWIAKLKPKYNMTRGGDGGDTSRSPNWKPTRLFGENNGMFGVSRPDAAKRLEDCKEKRLKALRKPVSCEGIIFNSITDAEEAYPGISVRKRLNSDKYPDFYRIATLVP